MLINTLSIALGAPLKPISESLTIELFHRPCLCYQLQSIE